MLIQIQRLLQRLQRRLKTLLMHPLTRLRQRVLPDRNIHRNLNRPGRNIPNVLVVIQNPPLLKPGKPESGRCDTRNHARRCETLCRLGACLWKYRYPVREAGVDVLWSGSSFRRILGSSCGICSQTRGPVLQSQLRQRGLQPDSGRIQGVIMSLLNEVQKFIEAHPGCTSGDIADAFYVGA